MVPISDRAVHRRAKNAVRRCIPNDTPYALRVTAWALVALLATCASAYADTGADDVVAMRVLFSFGSVETLRDGETAWEFTRPNMVLGPHDIVRMPPGALLRLESVGGDRLDLLSGIGEGTATDLLSRAASQIQSRDPQPYVRSAEAAEPVVLPVGAPNNAPAETTGGVTLDAATEAAWMIDRRHEHEVVRELVARVVIGPNGAPSTAPSYMPPRVALAHALFAAMATELAEPSPLSTLFSDSDSAPAFAFASLLTAADVPIHRVIDGNRRAVILLDAGVPRDQTVRLTASRALFYTHADGTVVLPLGPASGQTTFLEAWYAGEGAHPDAD